MGTLTAQESSDLFRSEPDRYVDVGGAEVAVRTVGSGPDVLFVHGWPVSGATFRGMLPHLANDVTCHVLDMPGAGDSRVADASQLSIAQHISTVRSVVDELELSSYAVVGHDSGGMIARHAAVGDDRLRGVGLINTEPIEVGWRFKAFVGCRRVPGFGRLFASLVSRSRTRRSRLGFGGGFVDTSLLDGEFDEFFLRPLYTSRERLDWSMRVLKSYEHRYVDELGDIHRRLDVPVRLVWGARDPFFPVRQARDMVPTFPNAELVELANARLFSHEECPAEAAAGLLPALLA